MPRNARSRLFQTRSGILRQHHDISVEVLLKLATYLMSNNLLHANNIISEELYKRIQRNSDFGFFEQLQLMSHPTKESLTENIFRLAVENDDSEMAEKLLKFGINPNEQICFTKSKDRATPLERASMLRNYNIIRFLMKEGANVTKSFGDNTPLENLVMFWDPDKLYERRDPVEIDIVSLFLQAGAQVNNSVFGSNLNHAISAGDTKLVDLLISAGANVNIRTFESCPLLQAIIYSERYASRTTDYLIIVKTLLKAGAYLNLRNNDGSKMLRQVLQDANIEFIKLLLEYQVIATDMLSGQTDQGCTQGTITEPETKMTRNFIINPEYRTKFALDLTISGAGQETKRKNTSKASDQATYCGDYELFEILQVVLIHPDTELLIEAIKNRNLPLAMRLIKLGAPIHYRSGDINKSLTRHHRSIPPCFSVLPAAVGWGHIGLIQEIISAGADLDMPSRNGEIPLTVAIKHCNMEIFNILVEAGADVNAYRWRQYREPLMVAVERGYLSIVNSLLSHGAEVTNSLLVAAVKSSSEVMEALVATSTSQYS